MTSAATNTPTISPASPPHRMWKTIVCPARAHADTLLHIMNARRVCACSTYDYHPGVAVAQQVRHGCLPHASVVGQHVHVL